MSLQVSDRFLPLGDRDSVDKIGKMSFLRCFEGVSSLLRKVTSWADWCIIRMSMESPPVGIGDLGFFPFFSGESPCSSLFPIFASVQFMSRNSKFGHGAIVAD